MDPKIWGPHAWFFLHTVAFAYPYKPTPSQQLNMRQFLINLGSILPCQVCQQHYQENLQQNSIDNAVQSKDKLFVWLVNIHNAVNRQLNKPEMSLESAYQKYRNHYGLEPDLQYLENHTKPIKWYLWVILILVVTVGLTKYFWPQLNLSFLKKQYFGTT